MLYKYLPPEAADYALTESGLSIRTSQASSLNDPFEINHVKEEIIDLMKNIDRESWVNSFNITQKSTLFILDEYINNESESQYLQFEDMFSDSIDKQYGILSLSRNRSSRPMWAYYSKDHTGFLVGIKSKKNDNSEITIGDLIFKKVEYSLKRPSISLKDKIKFSLDHGFFRKDIAWKHECESRAIVRIDKMNSLKTDSKGYSIICHQFPPHYIDYIVLGARSSNVLKRKIKNWISTVSPKTKLYMSVPSRTEYKLEYIAHDTH